MTSVTLRITIGFFAVVTFTAAVILTVGGWVLSRQMVRGLALMNEAEFVEVRDRLGTENHPLNPVEITNLIGKHMQIDAALYYCQIHSPSGEILYRSPNLGDVVLPIRSQNISLPSNWSTKVPSLGSVHISEFSYDGVHVQIASPLAPTQRLMDDYVRVAMFLFIGTAVGSLGLGYAFARFTLQPVRSITEAARRISATNLTARIPVRAARDDVDRLAILLNETFDRLNTSFEQIRRFTADASHELKTPLSLIRLNAEKLRAQVAADPNATVAVEDILVEIERLQQIIETLLFLSKAEAGGLSIQKQQQPVDSLITRFTEDAVILAEDAQVKFVLRRNDPGAAVIEPNLIRQVLFNLLMNALHVSKDGAQISMDSLVSGHTWRVVLTDEGPGLPKDQLDHVFERFVRIEHPSSRARSGHGLGLAICRSIAELHGGKIFAANRTDRSGLVVTMEIPV